MTDSSARTSRWGAAITRLAESFGDPARLFTWAEVEFIIRAVRAAARREGSAAARVPDRLSYLAGVEAGYRQRVAEENASYPAPAVFSAGELAALSGVQGARAAARADRTQRWAGGTAEQAQAALMWDADRPDPVGLGPSARTWAPGAGLPLRYAPDGSYRFEDEGTRR